MISFKVKGENISPMSVWYHSRNVSSESYKYKIEIINEPKLIATLEKSFGINGNKEILLQKICEYNESHFNIISLITQFLIKIENFPKEDIKWVFNTVDRAFFEENKLKIFGLLQNIYRISMIIYNSTR